MSDRFSEGFFCGLFFGVGVMLFVLVGVMSIGDEHWERDAVVHGCAEWATDAEGGVEWRWRDAR